MNLAETCFVDDEEHVRLRPVPYTAQLLAQLVAWQRAVGEHFTMLPRQSRPQPTRRPCGRVFRSDSIPYHVMLQLAKCEPRKLLASEVCKLLPLLPPKPISVALYELTKKRLLAAQGRHNSLRYGVTDKGLDILQEHDLLREDYGR